MKKVPYKPKKVTPPVRFTEDVKRDYLDLYRNHPELGGMRHLCREALGVSIGEFKTAMKEDSAFAEAFEDGRQSWIDENIFRPALQRARDGVERPIVGGKFRDEVITYERVYSDRLMELALKAHRPEFREKDPAPGTAGAAPAGVLIVPASPQTIGEWMSNFSELAKGRGVS
jgi:hypothetical protein